MGKRQAAERRGQKAEAICALRLRFAGYKILTRNFRCRLGEIDIIAWRRGIVIFIEVKARETEAAALEAVTPKQQSRIEAAAQFYLQKYPPRQVDGIRFDVMTVVPGSLPKHHPDAWRPSI